MKNIQLQIGNRAKASHTQGLWQCIDLSFSDDICAKLDSQIYQGICGPLWDQFGDQIYDQLWDDHAA